MIPDLIFVNAPTATLLIVLVTVVITLLIPLNTVVITVLIALTTVVIAVLIPFHTVVTTVLTALNTVVTTVLIALNTVVITVLIALTVVVIAVLIPFHTVDINVFTAPNTVVITLPIAFTALDTALFTAFHTLLRNAVIVLQFRIIAITAVIAAITPATIGKNGTSAVAENVVKIVMIAAIAGANVVNSAINPVIAIITVCIGPGNDPNACAIVDITLTIGCRAVTICVPIGIRLSCSFLSAPSHFSPGVCLLISFALPVMLSKSFPTPNSATDASIPKSSNCVDNVDKASCCSFGDIFFRSFPTLAATSLTVAFPFSHSPNTFFVLDEKLLIFPLNVPSPKRI